MKLLLALIVLGLSPCSFAQDKSASGETTEGKKKSLPEQLIGYWIVDEKVMLEKMLSDAKKRSGKDPDPDTVKLMKERAAQMSKMMAMEFTEDASTMHTIAGAKKGTYTILSSDAKTGEIQIDITGDKKNKQAKEKGTFTIKKDTLSLRDRQAKAGDPTEVALVRIDAKRFKSQLAGIEILKKQNKAPKKEEAK